MTIAQSFIDGESMASADVYDNIDPATGRPLGSVARGGGDEVDRALDMFTATKTVVVRL